MTRKFTRAVHAVGFAATASCLPLFGTPGFATLDARRTNVDPVLQRDGGMAHTLHIDRAVRRRLAAID